MTKFLISAVFICIFTISCTKDDNDDETSQHDSDITLTDNNIDEDDNDTITENSDSDTVKDEDITISDTEANDTDEVSDNNEISDVDTINNDSTLNTGDESGNQPASGKVGAPCTKDEDCNNFGNPSDDEEMNESDTSQAAVCLLENEGFPEGYCSFMCDMDTSKNYGCNDADGKYIPYSEGWGDGFCYHKCTAPKDCRKGYRCESGACRPDCNDSDKTCTYGTCNIETNVCIAD